MRCIVDGTEIEA